MDLATRVYLERAEHEFTLSGALFRLSQDNSAKVSLGVDIQNTFYSSVITHSYYSIFYAANSILLRNGIKASSPNIHKNTYESFKIHIVETGLLDATLLMLYEKVVIRADALLEIFHHEKWKRGNYTYHTLPQANKTAAEDSLKNTKLFLMHIMKAIG